MHRLAHVHSGRTQRLRGLWVFLEVQSLKHDETKPRRLLKAPRSEMKAFVSVSPEHSAAEPLARHHDQAGMHTWESQALDLILPEYGRFGVSMCMEGTLRPFTARQGLGGAGLRRAPFLRS